MMIHTHETMLCDLNFFITRFTHMFLKYECIHLEKKTNYLKHLCLNSFK